MNRYGANGIPSPPLLLFAIGAGLAVATLYYNQPMLAVIGRSFNAPPSSLGLIPTSTQIGYALGILFLAPLGDRLDRRKVILAKGAALVVALAGTALAPSFSALVLLSLVVGICATLAQDIVPAAATMARDSNRGRIIGRVMTGLLLGILLSRVVSGVAAAQWGWRIMFFAAASSIGLFCAVAWKRLPEIAPSTRLSYGALLRSLGHLWLRHRALRQAAIAQGLLMFAFGAFWSTLALLLDEAPFHLGSDAAGAFGLAGAAGALAAPLAGHLSDGRGPNWVAKLGSGIVTLSFALLFAFPWISPTTYLWIIGISSIGFDFGLQGSLIAHQSIIYSLDPTARSRLNAVLFVGMFVAMALGSASGSVLLGSSGWMAVVGLMTTAAFLAFAMRASIPAPLKPFCAEDNA